MTTNELKDILANKLQAEGTYFQKSDISARKTKSGYRVVIKDYEHIPFTITLEDEKYFGHCVWVRLEDGDYIHFASSKKSYPIEEAVIYLGYYIGSRF